MCQSLNLIKYDIINSYNREKVATINGRKILKT